MRPRMKCNKENNIDYIKDICNGVENGGEVTMGHETKLTDVSQQHSCFPVLIVSN